MTIFLGNHRVREKILSDALKKKLPHALLISGPQGTGKFQFCIHLAEKILEKKQARFFSPEVMKVDTLYQEGVCSDMTEISRSSFFDQSHRKRLKKKTNTIGVDDLEKFTKHLFETTTGDYKIVLIRDVERMTRETANKFLKTLEEPPEKTLFLMSCSSEKKLLDTFVSRVRREYFTLASEETIQNFLEHETEAGKFSGTEQKELHDLASGRGEFLQKMIQDSVFFTQEKEKKEEAEKIPNMTALEKMAEAETLAKKGMGDIFETLSFLEKFLRKALRTDLHKKNPTTEISQKIGLISDSKKSLAQNGNKRMVLENLFLHL